MQFARFAVVGIMNTLVDFGVLNGLLWLVGYPLGWRLVLCNAVAFAVANVNSYFWNKRWTFSDFRPACFRQVLLFFGLTFVGLAINCLFVYLLTKPAWILQYIPAALWINLSKVLATFASMIWNYFSYRRWVFLNSSLPSCSLPE